MIHDEIRRRSLAETRQVLGEFRAVTITMALALLPGLLRGACVAGTVFGIGYSFSTVWRGYGGDAIALIPASTIAVRPLAVALQASAL